MIVVFEETGEERKVLRHCAVCSAGTDITELFNVVSAAGIAHIGFMNGTTACGKDATGDGWWWEL